jgi:hypothetical protein
MSNVFTNIHIQPSVESATSAVSLPRLRSVTNDPAREYAQRPGEVEKLPDSIAAMILSKKGFSKVSRNGIRVEGITSKPLNFWCEQSVTIAEKAGTNEKVFWVLNRLNPDVIHILKPSGEYVESIPLDEKAEWFNQDHLKILGAKRRSQQRSIDRVASLHAPDSEAAADAATANDAAMKSIVHTFPQPISPRDRRDSTGATVLPAASGQERIADATRAGTLSNVGGASARRPLGSDRDTKVPPTFPKADRIHEIQRHINGQRQSHEDRRRVRKSAARFGRVLSSVEAGVSPANRTDAAGTAATTQPVSEEEIW